jgi:hypothetical protein
MDKRSGCRINRLLRRDRVLLDSHAIFVASDELAITTGRIQQPVACTSDCPMEQRVGNDVRRVIGSGFLLGQPASHSNSPSALLVDSGILNGHRGGRPTIWADSLSCWPIHDAAQGRALFSEFAYAAPLSNIIGRMLLTRSETIPKFP